MNKALPGSDPDDFPEFLDLPYRIRLMVIEKMDETDKFQFSQCSELCSDESAPPVQDVHGLELYSLDKNHWMIYVVFGKYDNWRDRDYCWSLTIKKENDIKYVKCLDAAKQELWRTDLDPYTNLTQCACEHFKSILKYNQNHVEKLIISGMHMSNFDFGIRTLHKLDDLCIEGDVDVQQFLPMMGHPLTKLNVSTGGIGKSLSENIQIYYVKDKFHSSFTKLDYRQLLKLAAPDVRISIENLKVEDVFDFIDRWRNGELMNPFGRYQFDYHESNFDWRELQERLKLDEKEKVSRHVIKRSFKSTREAELQFYQTAIIFKWEHGKKADELDSIML